MIEINSRFCAIEGWIVDLEEHNVVSHNFATRYLTPGQQEKLASIPDLKVFKNIDTKDTVIVHTRSEELFRYLNTEDVEFVVLPERTVKKNSRSHIRAKKAVTKEFKLNCHPVTLGGKNKCYLHLSVPDDITARELSMRDIPFKKKTKDNTVFTKFIKVQEFKFTEDDHTLLKSFNSENNSDAKVFAGKVMTRLKETASANATGFTSRNIHTGRGNFIKDLMPATLETYGRRISYLLILLKNCNKLSVFSKYQTTAASIAGIMSDCQTATDFAQAIGSAVSSLSDGLGDTEFWMTWVFLGAFDFGLWDKYEDVCPCVPIINYRYQLDSLMWIFRYGGVLYGVDKQAVIERWTAVEAVGNDFVGNIKALYFQVSKESNTSATNLVKVYPDEQCATINDHVLSYDIIGAALKDLTEDFDGHVKELSQWLTFGDFNQLYFTTLGAPHQKFHGDGEAMSILHNFSENAFQHTRMEWRNQEYITDGKTKDKVKDLINLLNKEIMMMVWMSTGMPMRFPELSTLTFAGDSRNIYIDIIKRRLYLNVKYNKNHQFTNRNLFLTEGVSRRLWWTFAILRTFTFITFSEDDDKYDKMMFLDEMRKSINNDMEFDESVIEDEDSLDATAASNNEYATQVARDINASPDTSGLVLKMFAFVDIKSHKLFDLRQFTNLLKSYPKDSGDKQYHTISTWRQGLAALWKYFIIPRINLGVERIVTAGLGHSTDIFKQAYGIDRRFAESTDLRFSGCNQPVPFSTRQLVWQLPKR